MEAGDVEKQVEAQEKMGQLAIEKERLRLRKNKLAQQEQKTEDELLLNKRLMYNQLNNKDNQTLKLKSGLKTINGLELTKL